MISFNITICVISFKLQFENKFVHIENMKWNLWVAELCVVPVCGFFSFFSLLNLHLLEISRYSVVASLLRLSNITFSRAFSLETAQASWKVSNYLSNCVFWIRWFFWKMLWHVLACSNISVNTSWTHILLEKIQIYKVPVWQRSARRLWYSMQLWKIVLRATRDVSDLASLLKLFSASLLYCFAHYNAVVVLGECVNGWSSKFKAGFASRCFVCSWWFCSGLPLVWRFSDGLILSVGFKASQSITSKMNSVNI